MVRLLLRNVFLISILKLRFRTRKDELPHPLFSVNTIIKFWGFHRFSYIISTKFINCKPDFRIQTSAINFLYDDQRPNGPEPTWDCESRFTCRVTKKDNLLSVAFRSPKKCIPDTKKARLAGKHRVLTRDKRPHLGRLLKIA